MVFQYFIPVLGFGIDECDYELLSSNFYRFKNNVNVSKRDGKNIIFVHFGEYRDAPMRSTYACSLKEIFGTSFEHISDY